MQPSCFSLNDHVFFSCCIDVWSQANQSAISGLMLVQKHMRWNHCKILHNYKILSIENVITFLIVFKCVKGYAPDIACTMNKKNRACGVTTRSVANGNCKKGQRKRAFGRSLFAVKEPQIWNSLPSEMKLLTDLDEFNNKIKQWFKSNLWTLMDL